MLPFEGNFPPPLPFWLNSPMGDIAASAWRLPLMAERNSIKEPENLSFSDIYQGSTDAGKEVSKEELESIVKEASNLEFSTPELNKQSGKEPDYTIDARGKLSKNPNSKARPGDPLNIEIQTNGQPAGEQQALVQSILDGFRNSHPWTTAFPKNWDELMQWFQQCMSSLVFGEPIPSASPGADYSGTDSNGNYSGGDGGGNYMNAASSGGGDVSQGYSGGNGGSYSFGAGGESPTAVDGLSAPITADGRVFPVDGFSKDSIGLHHGSSDGAADIFAQEGTAIRSLFDGEVVKVDSGGLGGNTITIKQADGKTAYYAHMQTLAGREDGTPLKPGDTVEAGDVIGRVGETGNAAGTGSHLHIGVGDSIISGSGPDGGAGSNYNLTGTLNTILQSEQVA